MGGQRRGCHVRRHAFALTQSSLDISRGGPARASVIKIFFKNRSGGSAQKIDDAFWGSNGARAHSAEPLSKMLRAMLQEPTSCIERAPMLCLSVCARGLGNVEGCFSPVAKIPISFAPWCSDRDRAIWICPRELARQVGAINTFAEVGRHFQENLNQNWLLETTSVVSSGRLDE